VIEKYEKDKKSKLEMRAFKLIVKHLRKYPELLSACKYIEHNKNTFVDCKVLRDLFQYFVVERNYEKAVDCSV